MNAKWNVAFMKQLRREKPPERFPAAGVVVESLGFDGGGALAVVAFGGRHRQPHLLANRAGQEAAHGMWLPACSFHKLFRRDAARSLEQVEHLGPLASV